MSAGFTVDPGVLLAGALLLLGVIASGLAGRLRIPSLLLFLGLGMLVADDGLALIRFDDAGLAQNIATVALVVILFEGGLGTDPAAFRTAGIPAGFLATIGVAITAGVVALATWLALDISGSTALLMGAVVASTDAAAVFAALRTEALPVRTRRLLQLESGLNDPVAVLLTIGLVEVWRSDPTPWDWALFLTLQLGAGLAVGVAVGVFGRAIVDRITGPAASSLGVVTLAIAAISYGAAATIGGSGFLAVYLTGVIVATSRRSARSVLYFHEGLAATAQGVLFLLLGILVFPSELFDYPAATLVVVSTLVFVARPLAVVAVLAWSRTPLRRMAVISWAGLRGAVPVVLATIPFTAGHPDGPLIFRVTFVVVVLSVAVQGPTVGLLARRLGVVAEQRVTVRPEIVPVESLDADLVEVTLPVDSMLVSTRLRDVPPPGGSRVVLVRRDDETIIPDGATTFTAGDVLLMISPTRCDLEHIESWSRSATTHPETSSARGLSSDGNPAPGTEEYSAHAG